MQCPDRWSIEPNEPATLEDAVNDRLSKILIVEHAPPCFQRFVGRKDHRPTAAMSFVDDVKEHVCGIRAVREVADLVDDQDGWMRVDLQRFRELSLAKRGRKIVNEGGG